ncbi:MAG: FAD-binding oxidoreductase, partial [Mesorhizobium sp.]|nr:FAD-binding oxidoreductase [Mesorhizobium sp.]
HGAGWRVAAPGGAVEAEHVVIATNGYTGALWPGLAETLVPVYSTIVATEPLPAELAARVLPSGSVLFEVGLNTVYYRLDAQNRLLMGGRSVQRPLRGIDDARHLIAYAVRLWPELGQMRWRHAWSGKVAITEDKYIHLHEPAPGVHIWLGYNGRGIATATAMGKALAARIAGDTAPIPIPVTGLTPFPFRRFARIGVTARLIYGRVRDSLGV